MGIRGGRCIVGIREGEGYSGNKRKRRGIVGIREGGG